MDFILKATGSLWKMTKAREQYGFLFINLTLVAVKNHPGKGLKKSG